MCRFVGRSLFNVLLSKFIHSSELFSCNTGQHRSTFQDKENHTIKKTQAGVLRSPGLTIFFESDMSFDIMLLFLIRVIVLKGKYEMSFINEQGFLSNSRLKLATELNQIHKFFKNFKNNYNILLHQTFGNYLII